MLEHLRRMYAYDTWALRKTFDALDTVPDGPDAAMLGLLAHILSSKQLWLGRIHATEDGSINTWPTLSLAECEVLLDRMQAGWDELLAGIDEVGLANVVRYTTAAGDPGEQTVADILTHKMLHAMYHRGQLVAMIRVAGGSPTGTDFVVWTKAMRSVASDQ